MRYFFYFLGFCTLTIIGSFFYLYAKFREEVNVIIDYKPKLTTQIFDINHNLIANIFEENRIYVNYDDIPPRLIEALVAIEDTSYFEHGGINFDAIIRAIIKDIKAGKLVEGASTLTQQLVKNLILTREKKFTRKLKEIFISIALENNLSKEEIIERYLNEIYFGHGYYGVKTAALGYFRKPLSRLNLKEMAILVGIPKSPSTYDPTKHLDLSLSRANRVISRMKEIGWINEEEYQTAINQEPIIYNDSLSKNKAPYAVDEIIKEASKEVSDIKTGGYIIQSTIDLSVQQMADESLKFGYLQILKRDKNADENNLNGAIVVTKPYSGEILALSGGVNYAKSSYNRATQSKRQPGSSFKPFIYQIALNRGYSVVSDLEDVPRIFELEDGKEWSPKNYGGDFKGDITMRQALIQSRNLATINLLDDLGLSSVLEELEQIGFKDIPHNLSIALGSFGISILEFAKFYSIFPNEGVMVKPHLIKNIQNNHGLNINKEIEKNRIYEAKQGFLMLDMLKDIVKFGTGRNAKVNEIEIAGKTGTTNNNIDAWFCGFSPEIQAIIWYGNDNNTPMKKNEGGGVAAAPVFKKFMKEYIQKFPNTKRNFERPQGVFKKNYNGKDEYYTDVSPLPKDENLIDIFR